MVQERLEEAAVSEGWAGYVGWAPEGEGGLWWWLEMVLVGLSVRACDLL
jgi:hypothetical protein